MDLGVPPGTLDRWVEIARSRATDKGEPEMTVDERNELKRLRREVVTLRQERDFLKKAAAFFAKENDPRSR
jgi:transposase